MKSLPGTAEHHDFLQMNPCAAVFEPDGSSRQPCHSPDAAALCNKDSRVPDSSKLVTTSEFLPVFTAVNDITADDLFTATDPWLG